MNKTIGVLAHVDAGKTTFSEQLLFHTKSINKRGRVDHQSAFLDNHEIEKKRGITVFAEQGMFTYGDSTYYLIDTPGHVDFSPEMERAVQVMDCAIVIISAVEGIEGHTETVWRLLRKHHIPTFFFINKMDRTGSDLEQVMQEIHVNLTDNAFHITGSFHMKEMSEALIEFVAERDEELFEYYLENRYDSDLWLESLKRLVSEGQIFLCSSGSALHDIGINNFLEVVDLVTETSYDNEKAFSGRVYKIRYDRSGTRMTFMKALSGRLKVRDELPYGSQDNKKIEKITQIRIYNGNTYETTSEVKAGDLFAVTGISNASVGDGVGELDEHTSFEMIPTLRSKVVFESAINIKEALTYFKILDAEDPSLKVTWEESTQQILIHVMGTIQLEVLEQIVFDRFGLTVRFEKPEIVYKETVSSEVVGYGHFEPLRHYAEVHFKIEPAPRNSGIQFESVCHSEQLAISFQHLVKQYVFEREHHGLLTGSGLTDVKITLLTGQSHHQHTHGGDFREATFRAIRQGLEKAKNSLLEPYYRFKIKVDSNQMGRVLSDIQAAHGRFDAPLTEGNKAIIVGDAPVATFMNYSEVLASFTKGKGSMSLMFAGYDRCHNEEEVIERRGYDKNADKYYTSSSVFCAKGAGYSVKWDEAEKMMHLLG